MAAALCFAAWMAIGYHQDQMNAAAALGQSRDGGASDLLYLTRVRQTLLAVVFFMIAISVVLCFPVWRQRKPMNKKEIPDPSQQPNGSPAFQPIRTQQELADDDQEQSGPRQNGFSRAVSHIVRSAFSRRETSKNQP